MILPLIGQECVVTHKGQQTIATVRRAYVNHQGRYRIEVFAHHACLNADFLGCDVRLRSFVFDDGEVYDAKAAFEAAYTPAQIQAMDEAETSSAIVPAAPMTTPPAPLAKLENTIAVRAEQPRARRMPPPAVAVAAVARMRRRG